MEDDEELTPEPDEKGQLILSNRAWVHLDPIIWTMTMKLVKLDVSYNHITEIPPQIGEMVMLRELIASFNKITTLPAELGKLRRLRRLLLNNNRIKVLPLEIGNMEMLEELICSENMIEDLPLSVSRIPGLKVIKMTNNRLRSIPFEIANILSLEEIDCGNNPHMETVPAKWRGDTESLLFVCRVHRDYNVQMTELNVANVDLSKHAQLVEQGNLVLKEKVVEMQARIDELNLNMPKKVAKKMELAAKRAADLELMAEAQQADKNANKCVIS